jgi:hypothetical protein
MLVLNLRKSSRAENEFGDDAVQVTGMEIGLGVPCRLRGLRYTLGIARRMPD